MLAASRSLFFAFCAKRCFPRKESVVWVADPKEIGDLVVRSGGEAPCKVSSRTRGSNPQTTNPKHLTRLSWVTATRFHFQKLEPPQKWLDMNPHLERCPPKRPKTHYARADSPRTVPGVQICGESSPHLKQVLHQGHGFRHAQVCKHGNMDMDRSLNFRHPGDKPNCLYPVGNEQCFFVCLICVLFCSRLVLPPKSGSRNPIMDNSD